MKDIELTNGHGPQIGDPCPRENCSGVLHVYATKVSVQFQKRTRYLRCNKCKCRPGDNQQVLPLRYAPGRSRSSVTSRRKPRADS